MSTFNSVTAFVAHRYPMILYFLVYCLIRFWDESQPHDNNLCLAFLSSDFLTWVGDSNVAIAPLIDRWVGIFYFYGEAVRVRER